MRCFSFFIYPIKIINRPYQNDRSDRGIISWFYRTDDFTIEFTTQTSILQGVTLLVCFTCKCIHFTEATSFVDFLYFTNILRGGAATTTTTAAAEEFSQQARSRARRAGMKSSLRGIPHSDITPPYRG